MAGSAGFCVGWTLVRAVFCTQYWRWATVILSPLQQETAKKGSQEFINVLGIYSRQRERERQAPDSAPTGRCIMCHSHNTTRQLHFLTLPTQITNHSTNCAKKRNKFPRVFRWVHFAYANCVKGRTTAKLCAFLWHQSVVDYTRLLYTLVASEFTSSLSNYKSE
jgi:hypothetical protein